MFRITAKEEVFFDLFITTINDCCEAAKLLLDLVTNYENIEEKICIIEDYEHKCDNHLHKMLEILNKSFITPIDREDIFLIAKEMDNIIDAVEATAHRFKMFNVTSIREDAIELSKLIVQGSEELRRLVYELRNFKTSKKMKDMFIEVNRIENQGDDIFRYAMHQLFTSDLDTLEVLKWKEIYEFLENTLDALEEVANAIESVAMKNS